MRSLKFMFVIIMGLFSLVSLSQVPESLNYQAIVRNSEGELVKNQNLSARVSIVDDQTGTNVIYQETLQTSTNEYGSLNIKIGAGTESIGAFNDIDWASSERFIQVEIDLGEGYINLGSVQLVSVPYALYAKQVLDKNDADSDTTNEIQDLILDNNILTISKNQSPTEISLAAYQGDNTDNQVLDLTGTTLSISGGNDIDVSSLVNDADAIADNEIQLLTISNDTIFLEKGGFVKLPKDQVNDGDTSQTNEIQNLIFSGDTLKLAKANEVILPYDTSRWTDSGDDLYFSKGKVGIGVTNPNSKLEVKADTSFSETDTLFAVKDRNGKTVFAVFPDGVRVIVDEQVKGNVGGFAVSGRGTGKGYVDYLMVSSDSTRVYINDYTKAQPGGFAVSGRGTGKGTYDFLSVTPDSTRIYVNEGTKAMPGGFAVSGRGTGKLGNSEYLRVTKDSTRIYISDTSTVKGQPGGFAVSGRGTGKVGSFKDYFNVLGNATAKKILNESRVMWYPEKSALLAGELYVPDPDSVGEYSLALGYRNIAKGDWSQAMGYQSTARGTYATAIGTNAVADTNSFAFGTGTKALGYNSFAFGTVGLDSLGSPTTNYTAATGDYSFAFGLGSEASGTGSFVLGTECNAYGDFSTAAGFNTEAIGFGATAMGGNNIAEGAYSITLGNNNNAVGLASVAFGSGNTAEGLQALVAGYDNVAAGRGAIAFGISNVVSNDGAFASGTLNQSTGVQSTAFGNNNTAEGSNSFAIGSGTHAEGVGAFAVGSGTHAAGDYSFVAGYSSSTGELAAGALAIGNSTSATGMYSAAFGEGTSVNAYGSVVVGRYNSTVGEWPTAGDMPLPTEPAFIVGVGSSSTPKDGFVAYKDGSAMVNGNFYPGANGSYSLGTSSNTWSTVYAGKGVVNTSDQRLKKDIENMTYGLNEVLKLRPVTFKWKAQADDVIKLGLIAQEVQPIIKEVVNVGNDQDRTLGILYTDLVPVLIKSIQEQQQIIEKEKEKNKALQKQIDEILMRLEKLENK